MSHDVTQDEIEVVQAFLDAKLSIPRLVDPRYSARQRALVAWAIILTVRGNVNEEGMLRHPLSQLFDEIYLPYAGTAELVGHRATTASYREGWHESRNNYAVRPTPPRQLMKLLRSYRQVPPGIEQWILAQRRRYEEQARDAYELIRREPLAVHRIVAERLGFL